MAEATVPQAAAVAVADMIFPYGQPTLEALVRRVETVARVCFSRLMLKRPYTTIGAVAAEAAQSLRTGGMD